MTWTNAAKEMGHGMSWVHYLRKKYAGTPMVKIPRARRSGMTRMEVPPMGFSAPSGKVVILMADVSQLRDVLKGLE